MTSFFLSKRRESNREAAAFEATAETNAFHIAAFEASSMKKGLIGCKICGRGEKLSQGNWMSGVDKLFHSPSRANLVIFGHCFASSLKNKTKF